MAKTAFSFFMAALLAFPSWPAAGQAVAASYPDRLKDVDQPVAGQSLVIGSIKLFKDGKQRTCGEFIVSDCRLIVLPPVGSHAMIYTFRGGDFSWSLPPGEYAVVGFEYVENGIARIPARAHFKVPAGGKTVYVGDLTLITSGKSTAPGLADAYDRALAEFRAKHPDRQPPENASMKQEEEPGGATSIKYICAEGWGINCTKQFHGITPVRPVEVRGFSAVDRLDPIFQWQPSTDPQVTYDVIVYEAADYKGRNGTNYVLGRIAAYRQGLTSSVWQIDRPLTAGQRYFWSVRLRKGDTVTNWSTYTYFNFFLIGASFGSGQWFSFTTPGGVSTGAR
jgi:hypothetical protein